MRLGEKIGRLAAATAVAAVVVFAPASGEAATACPAVAAHRGASDVAPEETLPAIVSAAKADADYVEFDVRWTRSSVAVLMHDPKVDRTTNGTGYVSSYAWWELNRLDAGSKFSPAYAGAHVATLGAALRAVRPFPGVKVLPEIKAFATDAQLAAFSRTLTYNGMHDRAIVQAASATILQRMHKIDPALPLALITRGVTDPVATVRAAQASYWLPYVGDVTAANVAAANTAGIGVMPWVSDTTEQWSNLASWGVKAVITNHASTYRGWALSHCGL